MRYLKDYVLGKLHYHMPLFTMLTTDHCAQHSGRVPHEAARAPTPASTGALTALAAKAVYQTVSPRGPGVPQILCLRWWAQRDAHLRDADECPNVKKVNI